MKIQVFPVLFLTFQSNSLGLAVIFTHLSLPKLKLQ